MADAAARREARRRRILENSHSRLQLISGKLDDESLKDSPRRTPILDLNVDVPFITEVNTSNTCFLNNGVINSEIETVITNAHETHDGEVTNDLAAFTSTPDTQPHNNLIDKLVNNKYDIVLLSLLLQLLYGLSIITFEKSFFFLPLMLYTVTKAIFFPAKNNSNIMNALLLLNGISARKVKLVMYFTQIVTLFSRDVCVFLFTTICVQYLCIVLKVNTEVETLY